ncbi:hypothetical protein LTR84_003197 [Exophiala bonariae]|uniref:Flavin reductase like domain-containing protein n=1 Tax=Exophiala bonariae TaxID=1690606 RepID=A0AAV9NBQ9_9EURO|nr:hypothetical protein LTR84_003197 [Exophiala bonariae]
MSANTFRTALLDCFARVSRLGLIYHAALTTEKPHLAGNNDLESDPEGVDADDNGDLHPVENSKSELVTAFDDPASLYQYISPVSHTRHPRVALGIIVSSNKYSKSGVEPFTINFQVGNLTPHILTLSNIEPVRPMGSSVTNGPIVRLVEQSIRGVIAQYRLEIFGPDTTTQLLPRPATLGNNSERFKTLQPLHCSEHAAWINSPNYADLWCKDLKLKLMVGMHYTIDIMPAGSLWGRRIMDEMIECEFLNRRLPSFEVVE